MKVLKRELGPKKKIFNFSSWWKTMEPRDGISSLLCFREGWESSAGKDGTIISIQTF
jgi:hypothetical protein